MDIRIINSEGSLINVSRLSLRVMRESLIGVDEEKNIINVETFESEERAREVLKSIVFAIWGRHNEEDSNAPIIINLNVEYMKEFEKERRGGEELNGESKEHKEEYKNTEGDA